MRKMHHRGFGLSRVVRFLAAAFAVMSLMLVASHAEARGSVRIRNRAPQEDEGTWKLKFTIDYGSKPHLAHVPMIFSFKPVILYERQLTDATGDTPVQRRVPLHNQTPIVVSMDVGFADARGEVFKITKFSVKLRRENDFEAGEYELTVKLASGGNIGTRQRIKLLGNNKVVDRRSMVFGGSVSGGDKKKAAPKTEEPKPSGPVAAEDMGPDLSDIPDDEGGGSGDEGEPVETPPEVEPKQGGCGCKLGAPEPIHDWLTAFAVLALALGICIRRRRRVEGRRRAQESGSAESGRAELPPHAERSDREDVWREDA